MCLNLAESGFFSNQMERRVMSLKQRLIGTRRLQRVNGRIGFIVIQKVAFSSVSHKRISFS